jgi:uncharacterized caspase-like protein
MADQRFALIVATSDYAESEFSELVAPAQDADALAAVLRNPAIGGYDLTELHNEPSSKVQEEIETFFSDRARDDLVLLYFSCHGVKDKDGKLYFATCNTRRRLLRSTGIAAGFINDIMASSDSRRQLLILDCCYSGAFSRGMQVKSDDRVAVLEDLKGEGRAVLTASDAMQYAFVEGQAVRGHASRSVFTSCLVQGLETGEADVDHDGIVSFDDLFAFLTKQMRERTKDQTPTRTLFAGKGEFMVARSPRRPTPAPVAPKRAAVPRTDQTLLDRHCRIVARDLARGRVVPVLGENANLCGRPATSDWSGAVSRFPPVEDELASHLAATCHVPASEPRDLMSVGEFVATILGRGVLYREMRRALAVEYLPNPLHDLLARVPALLRERDRSPSLVVLTTNYDTALEQAFDAAAEPFDLVVNTGPSVIHYPPDGRAPIQIERPNAYMALAPEERPTIVKLRGGVSRASETEDVYIVSQEDHLGRSGAGIGRSLPVLLRQHLADAHDLFLGQSARHRGIRMLLNQIWDDRLMSRIRESWAIQEDPDESDERFWHVKGVQLLNVDLGEYVRNLEAHLFADDQAV